MRSTKPLWLALFVLTIALSACKKGEEDPFFSLLSRKARVSGEWILTSIEGESRVELGADEWYNMVSSGDENTIITLESNPYANPSATKTCTILSYSMTIDKDGTWSKIIQLNCEVVTENEEAIFTTTYPIDMSYMGTWAFVGKTKDAYKNKERIALNLTNYKEIASERITAIEYKDGSPDETSNFITAGRNKTYGMGQVSDIYEIIMLKSKEMKWLLESSLYEVPVEITGESLPELSYVSKQSETIIWSIK